MNDGEAELGEALGEAKGMGVDAEGDLTEAFRAVVDGIHRGKAGEEGLGSADVAGGAIAADMLFAGLEGEAVGDAASGIFGNADEATREEALVGRAGSDVGGVGSAKTDGDAESLGATDGDVGAEFAGRGEEKKGEGIGDEDGEGSCFFELKN